MASRIHIRKLVLHQIDCLEPRAQSGGLHLYDAFAAKLYYKQAWLLLCTILELALLLRTMACSDLHPLPA
jgi:hypothetical protein